MTIPSVYAAQLGIDERVMMEISINGRALIMEKAQKTSAGNGDRDE